MLSLGRQEGHQDSFSCIRLVELANQLYNFLSSPFHEVLECNLIVHIDVHSFAACVLVGNAQDVHFDEVKCFVVPVWMQK